ncbi:universal stress protein [Actinomadura gamaensis]|uniref:Universal stress protein n=1 Tax=Actinomadura gamaensis TaxID=1763541 RepID=A0ABV9UE97_9ACTN
MPAEVIVGIDGSAHAWRALDWAADHAVRHRLGLRLLHGSHALSPDGTIPERALRRLAAERRDLLAEAREYVLKSHPELEVATRLVAADPGRALVRASGGAALVSVGSRGVGGFEELLLGSVGAYAAAHARCPVLVVPRFAPYPADAPARLVVGVDGRYAENDLLEWAFREAASRGAELVALHAVGVEFGAPRRRVAEDTELAEALAGTTARFPDLPVKRELTEQRAARALVEASRNAALVVVGGRRRRGLGNVVPGRVVHAVLHHAHCPVVVVPRSDPEE